MKLTIPNTLRYGVVNLMEGNTSALAAWAVRSLIFVSLIVMAAPWRVSKEVAWGSNVESLGLKASMRAMLWIWNRSWIPFKFRFGTFFDIGWYLSQESCQALVQRGFVSGDHLRRQCDLAQLKLATIRACVESGDQARLQQADQKTRALVSQIVNDGYQWAVSAEHVEPASPPAREGSKPPAPVAGQRFDNDRTRAALLDFDDLSKSLGLSYFLVSGTFLGVVRDKAFIGHDHDIDVGVFEEDVSDDMVPALSRPGAFTVNQVDYICLRKVNGNEVRYAFMEKPAIVRLAHSSGISIDLFIHFHDGDLVWHGSSVHRWNNRRFDLGDYEFLERTFKGATDFDLYLTENYGPDWRVPKRQFNVNLDTPNLGFVGTANALVYFAWMVANAVAENNVMRVRKYIDMLAALGALELSDGRVQAAGVNPVADGPRPSPG